MTKEDIRKKAEALANKAFSPACPTHRSSFADLAEAALLEVAVDAWEDGAIKASNAFGGDFAMLEAEEPRISNPYKEPQKS